MLDLSIHDWKDALAAAFFVVVLPLFFVVSFASALHADFERKGDWAQIRRDTWKFNPDTFGESLGAIGFGALFLSVILFARTSLPLPIALFAGLIAAFVLAGLLTLLGRIFLTILAWSLEKRHSKRPPKP